MGMKTKTKMNCEKLPGKTRGETIGWNMDNKRKMEQTRKLPMQAKLRENLRSAKLIKKTSSQRPGGRGPHLCSKCRDNKHHNGKWGPRELLRTAKKCICMNRRNKHLQN